MSDEADGQRDAAEPDEAAIENIEPTKDAEHEFSPFDEVDEDFRPGPMRIVAEDGIVSHSDQTSQSDIPALSLKSLVCLGDYSAFVLRTRWGEVFATFQPEEVERTPNGVWRIAVEKAIERCKLRIEQERKRFAELRARYKEKLVNAGAALSDEDIFLSLTLGPGEQGVLDAEWIDLEPIRPPCKHFVRQQGSFHLNQTHRKFYRLCSARRTTEGTFMTVSDTGVFACDMRDPFDAESSKLLDDFDALKIQQGKDRVSLPMFMSGDRYGIFAPQKPKEEGNTDG